ncbi:MAG TPA: hemerythrin domain-containing protein [Rhodanobacteraceae bacterium]|jgi:hemerythrin-like domain-containing protein|nr:hemerythrin domain-containing protein [Rhodanobacteraceae bacterium]
MLTFLANWFRVADRGSRSSTDVAAAETSIAFKPALIDELRSEHRELVHLYKSLVSTHQRGDFDAAVSNLKRFTYALRAHLLKENLHLYVYLRHALRDDPESSALMASMRVEMGKIGRVLNDFVTRYTSSPWDLEVRQDLGGELNKIAEVLMVRIDQEEEVLYPMYLHPSRYR